MNFLAHLYLSGNERGIIIGNFIADHVKGRLSEQFSEEIRNGIILHKAIDEFTDNHPVVRNSVTELRSGFRKYAGVVLDMFFDHYLAAGWDNWMDEPLEQFSKRMYGILMDNFSVLPTRTKHMLPYMIRGNWLLHYREIEGLNQALNGMARRTAFQSNMEKAAVELRDRYAFYGCQFDSFFPELRAFSAEKLFEITRNSGV
ncbi:MAG TPA: ACP phosphodiesterase [Lentimicrobium sp.]|jgi:acyl carrier protein phosphodiesterase|nr:ACP phosphodiesterase [Lentimicrobium sp.]